MSFELGLGLVATLNLVLLGLVAFGRVPWNWLGISGAVLAVYLLLFLFDQYRQWRDWNAANAEEDPGPGTSRRL